MGFVAWTLRYAEVLRRLPLGPGIKVLHCSDGPSRAEEPEGLHDYVQERLSGRAITADGEILGPEGSTWKGRNKPHRRDRRWVTGWSPEQIARRLKVDPP